jgi:hypothetical protein
VYVPPLASTLLGKLQLQFQHLPMTCLIMYELKLNTGMIPAGPLTMPSSNICKIQATETSSYNLLRCV